ncbi:MAG: hypothetical protein DCC55_20715 [Chloroflexi bacterium]|nr:MAG: hypothetical protein DCC55_20715 [Chloroflexota bacterium]
MTMAQRELRLPTFFLLGAAKAGTTSLYAYLAQHPQICFAKVKEPHFFDDPNKYVQGPRWYVEQYFAGAEACAVCADATPMLHLPHMVASRLIATYGEAAQTLKFVVVLRDPVERAWSHYLDQVRFVVERETFARALELEPQRTLAAPLEWFGYFRDGLYAEQVETWLAHFSREQFLFVLNEDLKCEPVAVAREVFAFLGVETAVVIHADFETNVASQPRSRWLMRLISQPPQQIQQITRRLFSLHQRKRIRTVLRRWLSKPYDQKPQLLPEVANELRLRYQTDLQRLETLIGRDLTAWRQPRAVHSEAKS